MIHRLELIFSINTCLTLDLFFKTTRLLYSVLLDNLFIKSYLRTICKLSYKFCAPFSSGNAYTKSGIRQFCFRFVLLVDTVTFNFVRFLWSPSFRSNLGVRYFFILLLLNLFEERFLCSVLV